VAKFPVITVCGSMRYFDKMIEVANKLTADGNIVLMPFVYVIPPEQQKKNPLKEMLDQMHFVKIDMSESIVVVGMHIGESTSNEIAYAEAHGKKILHWTEHFGAIA
jgi:hypothetical protein